MRICTGAFADCNDGRHYKAKMTGKDNKDGKDRKKTGGGLSTTKLLAAAFAAITASLITTMLTSYVGSVIIVGVTSILVAVFSEVYTRVIRKTKRFGAKIAYKAVPYEKVLPDTLAARIDEKLIDVMSTTTAMPPIKPQDAPASADHDESPAPVAKTTRVLGSMDANAGMVAANRFSDDGLVRLVRSVDEAASDGRDAMPDADNVGNDDDEGGGMNASGMVTDGRPDADADGDGILPDDVAETTVGDQVGGGGEDEDDATPSDNGDGNQRHASAWKRLKAMFTLNAMTKGALLFLAIALTTSAVSWMITTYVGAPNVTNVTNVTEQRVQKLSDEEKDAIKQQVKDEVSSQLAQAQKDASDASDSASDLSDRVGSLERKLDGLESAMSGMQRSSGDGATAQSQQHGPDADNADDIEDMKKEIASLKSQIALMQSKLAQLESQDGQSTGGGTTDNGNGTDKSQSK